MARFEAMTSVDGDRAVVTPSGECDLAVVEELAKALLGALELARLVQVDLGGLTFMTPAAWERGGRVHVVNATGVVERVLDLTGVGDLLRPPATGDHEHV
jgi:anti-sigma B factor antagonist